MFKLLIVTLAGLVAYTYTGKHGVPIELKAIIAMVTVASAIWLGVSRTGDV